MWLFAWTLLETSSATFRKSRPVPLGHDAGPHEVGEENLQVDLVVAHVDAAGVVHGVGVDHPSARELDAPGLRNRGYRPHQHAKLLRPRQVVGESPASRSVSLDALT